jgi:peptidoglycan-N-acetylglucosamine deacetylase
VDDDRLNRVIEVPQKRVSTRYMSGLGLSFDDGPDPVWTGRILDLLQTLGASATFFPIAARASAQPRLIERMLNEGHSVGLHCLEHVRHTQRDAAWLRRDTSAALAILSRFGVDPVFWRTPWGVTAPWTLTVAREYGLNLVDWTVDTHDWRGDSAEEMFEDTRWALDPGSVVLAHDGIGPGARRETCEETFRYVELVAQLADDRGMALEAMKIGGPM